MAGTLDLWTIVSTPETRNSDSHVPFTEMVEDVSVVEDGATREAPRRRSNPGWLLAVTGFIMGLGLGILVVNPAPEERSSPVTASDAGLGFPTTVPSPSIEDVGVAELVSDFPDTLVAVTPTIGSTLNHHLWPLQGELRTRPMARGTNIVLDNGARFIALSESVPDGEGVLLSMGRFNQINPVATDVTSYVWHDEMSGVLSYTTETDGVWRLFVVRSSFSPELISETTEFGGELVGFGNWGWAVQTSPEEMSLLTPGGSLKAVEVGVGYASHRDGWLFMMDQRPKLVSSGGGVARLDVALDIGTVSAAAFSPDRRYVSVSGERGWAILDTSTGTVDTPTGFPTLSLTWSSDSRFALNAGGAGVVVYDTELAEQHFLFRGDVVLAVGTAPLSTS